MIEIPFSFGIPDEPPCYVRQYGGKSFKFSLSSISCLGVILLHLLCVLRYTTAPLQVLFSLHHLGGITKGLQK